MVIDLTGVVAELSVTCNEQPRILDHGRPTQLMHSRYEYISGLQGRIELTLRVPDDADIAGIAQFLTDSLAANGAIVPVAM